MISKNLNFLNNDDYQQDHVIKIPYDELDQSVHQKHRTNFVGRVLVYIAPLISTIMIILFCLDNNGIILSVNTFMLVLLTGTISFILAYVIVSTVFNENA